MDKPESNVKIKVISIWDKIPGFIKLVLIYALLNLVLYVGQELYHLPSTNKMNQLNSEMEVLDSDINRIESRANSGGLSEPYYSQYKTKIDDYNKKADEYNKLAKDSGSRWWLLPIPMPGGKAKTNL